MTINTIYFATNRNPDNTLAPTSFGSGFSGQDLGDLRFGKVDVSRNSHEMDASTIVVLPDNSTLGSQVLLKQLRESMTLRKKDTLILIHGFNVSFQQGVEHASSLIDKYEEVSQGQYSPNMFVFSWPSDGKVTHYRNDRHDAEASAYAFARGLLKLSAFLRDTSLGIACHQKINLIAHSMGNYVLRHSLQQIRKIVDGERLPRVFDNIILTAADEDSDAFEFDYKLLRLPELTQRITVYFNSGDLVLSGSDLTKGNPDRLGHDGADKPHQIPSKVVLIDVSDVVTGGFHVQHSYHLESDKVVTDMLAVLQGLSSESDKLSRTYVPHANKFRLF
ncbi:MAG: alpha/beta hydrolase [Moraxellaceae bacterium]|nr:alpha/beta hydrolase [Moraxellaceae bacterium]